MTRKIRRTRRIKRIRRRSLKRPIRRKQKNAKRQRKVRKTTSEHAVVEHRIRSKIPKRKLLFPILPKI